MWRKKTPDPPKRETSTDHEVAQIWACFGLGFVLGFIVAAMLLVIAFVKGSP